jgi:hypothetical protein
MSAKETGRADHDSPRWVIPRWLAGSIALLLVIAAAVGYVWIRGTPTQRFIACIEGKGWHRISRPFKIKNLMHLDLGTDWAGGPGAYAEVEAKAPGARFQLVAINEGLGEANQGRLLEEVQTKPSNFEAVLVADHPPIDEGRGQDPVVHCSFKIYPNQGP